MVKPVSAERSDSWGHAGLLGAALAWTTLSLLAVAAVFTELGTSWLATVLVSGLAAAGLGWLIGAAGLRWAGLGGAIGGLILATILPLAIDVALVLPTGSVATVVPVLASGWIEYFIYVGAGASAMAAGSLVGMRSARRVHLRLSVVVALGLVMLALWVALTVLIAFSSRAA